MELRVKSGFQIMNCYLMSIDECQKICAPTVKQKTGEEKSKKREALYIIKKRIIRFPSTVRIIVRKVRSLI